MNYLQKTASLFSEISASEKGYLKKYIKSRLSVLPPKKAEQFLTIFELIDKGAETSLLHSDNEEVVREAFMLLIAGLEEYHKHEATQVRSYINQVEILLEKNLNIQAEKLLAKAKKIAGRIDNYEMLYEIVEWQVAIHSLKAPTDKNMRTFDDYFGELEGLLEKQAARFDVVL